MSMPDTTRLLAYVTQNLTILSPSFPPRPPIRFLLFSTLPSPSSHLPSFFRCRLGVGGFVAGRAASDAGGEGGHGQTYRQSRPSETVQYSVS